MSESMKSYKRDAIRAARELMYSQETLAKLKAATTEGEISRAMIEGRRSKKYYM